MLAQWLAVTAAVMSALATGLAAWATWKGPLAAAKAAERLRRQGDDDAERRRLKLWVFTALMQERGFLASIDAVRALNLIDVVYRDSTALREAWAALISPSPQKLKFRSMLRKSVYALC